MQTYLDLASNVANSSKPKDENLETESSAGTNAVEIGSDRSVTVHKKPSKRSLDDAEFDDEDDEAAGSPPSSPG